MLQLMEGETARHFKDEYLNVALDASQIFWVATANNAELIPDYIRSRMIQYDVPPPTPGQSRVIAQNINAALLAAHDYPFEPVLSGDTQDVLSAVPPPRDEEKAARRAGQCHPRQAQYAAPGGHPQLSRQGGQDHGLSGFGLT